MILRDADEVSDTAPYDGWVAESAGQPETRLFYLQNCRADVVVTVLPAASPSSDPEIIDTVRYDSYAIRGAYRSRM